MKKFFLHFFIATIGLSFMSSCKVHNRMFQTEAEYKVDSIQKKLQVAERNYVLQKNDLFSYQVYSNGGERLIDPDFELTKKESGGPKTTAEVPKYLVKTDGTSDLPMIGNIHLEGYTLSQADSILAIQYSKYYKNSYVLTKLLNKRVIVLGPVSGTTNISVTGKVIPLENDNMNLIEVLALFGGITDRGKSYNIRVIRGDLKNPDVSIIDLSTIEGMKKANLAVYPNDIIYIESTRKVFTEYIRDFVPLMSILVSIITIVVVTTRK